MNNTITPKYYSKKELAAQYGISVRHLRREVLHPKFQRRLLQQQAITFTCRPKKNIHKIGEP